jgi:membrane-bound ClpP family serine protease
MIFLLGGRKNPAIRAIVGAVLLVAGIVIHGGAILIALGAVLIVWGAALALKKQRIDREAHMASDGSTR